MSDFFDDFTGAGATGGIQYDNPINQLDEKQIQQMLMVQMQQQQNQQQYQQPQYEQPQQQEPNAALLTEVERRLVKAQYYQTLLSGWLFDGDNSEAAVEVMEEIREHIVKRLNVLMGMAQEAQPQAPFSDEEVWALRNVAAKVLQRPNVVAPRPPPPQPKPPQRVQPKLRGVTGPQTPQVQRPQPTRQQPRQMQQQVQGVPTTKKDQAAPVSQEPIQQPPPPGRIPFPTGRGLESALAGVADRSVKTDDTGVLTLNQLGLR